MKTIICLIGVAILGIGNRCPAQKNYVQLSGQIINRNSDSLIIRSGLFTKKIKVNSKGFFSDTLQIGRGYCTLFDGKEHLDCYLVNGLDLNICFNTRNIQESIEYSGPGADENNYMANYMRIMNDKSIYQLTKTDFESKIKSYDKSLRGLLDKIRDTDSVFANRQSISTEKLFSYISSSYEEQRYITHVLAKGKASPKFVHYENSDGGYTSLEDLKGKYVYIDVWATWCVPCKEEIPYLKKLEQQFHERNITFVSISGDKAADHAIWKKMIQDEGLSGIQLIADADFNSSFMKAYKINAIPRFILIDPTGNIVLANAPRPSDQKMLDLLNELRLNEHWE